MSKITPFWCERKIKLRILTFKILVQPIFSKLKYRKLNALNDLQRDARIMTKQFLSMQHDLEKLQEYIQIIRTPDSPEERDGN